MVTDGDWSLVIISDELVVISIVIGVNHHLVVGLPLVVEIGVHILQDLVRGQLLLHARAWVIELLLIQTGARRVLVTVSKMECSLHFLCFCDHVPILSVCQ